VPLLIAAASRRLLRPASIRRTFIRASATRFVAKRQLFGKDNFSDQKYTLGVRIDFCSWGNCGVNR